MSKDLMGDMIERRHEILADVASVVEWFDPSKDDHMEAFKVLKESGQWPNGFIPEGLAFPDGWMGQLSEKVIAHLMEAPERPEPREAPERPEPEEPEEEEGRPFVPAEKEPTADVDLEKIYLGQSGETHFYVVSDKNEAGMTEDLQVIDQEGNVC